MFVDRVTVRVVAGNGGPGCTSFRREKFIPRGGPDGGDGGSGGNVLLVARGKLAHFSKVRNQATYKAAHGAGGAGARKQGRSGADCVLEVPTGTVVIDEESGQEIGELLKNGDKLIVANGGCGGRGNVKFATPQNRVPQHSEPGTPGEKRTLILELCLDADVVLLGLPAAGKSTLLRALTNAKPEIGEYAFTTRQPFIGVCEVNPYARFKIVELPALVRGSREGHGMGTAFLRHLRRVQMILFVLDATSDVPPNEQLEILNTEVAEGPISPDDLKQIVVINKVDALPEDELPETCTGRPVHLISAMKKTGLDELVQTVAHELDIL